MAISSTSMHNIALDGNNLFKPVSMIPTSTRLSSLLLATQFQTKSVCSTRKKRVNLCFAMEKRLNQVSSEFSMERKARKDSEKQTYLMAAIMSTLGFTSMAAMAVYYRFSWQMQDGGEFPTFETFCTFAFVIGAAVGMEFWARWAHKEVWHSSLWHMHESHHRPRDGAFELNDVFAIINAVPAIVLLSYGLFNKGPLPGICFGAGLGITIFGVAYMFVHDGLVHRRFPVGPIARLPYLRKVAAAHRLHHSEKFKGVPYGLFLGPQELEEVRAMEDLENEAEKTITLSDTKK